MFSRSTNTKLSTTATMSLTSWCVSFVGQSDLSIEGYAPSKRAHAANPEGAT